MSLDSAVGSQVLASNEIVGSKLKESAGRYQLKEKRRGRNTNEKEVAQTASLD